MKMAREAQGISQRELASVLGVSQASIAQFETLKITLSLDSMLKIGTALNLNPFFVENNVGNPFKPVNKENAIKMFVPEAITGEIDFSLIELILVSNDETNCIFLTPPINDSKLRKRIQGLFYALLIKDDDGNIFIMRRKKDNALLGNISEWMEILNKLSAGHRFTSEIMRLSTELFWQIRGWKEISNSNLKVFFHAEKTGNTPLSLETIFKDSKDAILELDAAQQNACFTEIKQTIQKYVSNKRV